MGHKKMDLILACLGSFLKRFTCHTVVWRAWGNGTDDFWSQSFKSLYKIRFHIESLSALKLTLFVWQECWLFSWFSALSILLLITLHLGLYTPKEVESLVLLKVTEPVALSPCAMQGWQCSLASQVGCGRTCWVGQGLRMGSREMGSATGAEKKYSLSDSEVWE